MKKLFLITVLMMFAKSTMAAGLINDMQSCQGLIDFVNTKLDAAPASYDDADIKTVRSGLNAYNAYIQQEIVSPGLLKFNGGNQAKAEQMQKQVDTYKQSLVTQYQKRYPQNRLFTDFAMGLNNCAKKAVPAGGDLEKLKQALHTIIKLSKQGG